MGTLIIIIAFAASVAPFEAAIGARPEASAAFVVTNALGIAFFAAFGIFVRRREQRLRPRRVAYFRENEAARRRYLVAKAIAWLTVPFVFAILAGFPLVWPTADERPIQWISWAALLCGIGYGAVVQGDVDQDASRGAAGREWRKPKPNLREEASLIAVCMLGTAAAVVIDALAGPPIQCVVVLVPLGAAVAAGIHLSRERHSS